MERSDIRPYGSNATGAELSNINIGEIIGNISIQSDDDDFEFDDSLSDPTKVKVTNDLNYNPQVELGVGSPGTSLFLGTFGDRKVAVKRINIAQIYQAQREQDILHLADQNEHIVKLHCYKKTSEYLWIATELCEYNLGNYFNEPQLQENQVHRDIKPQNVLLKEQTDGWRVKICDFGISKKLDYAKRCTTTTFEKIGSYVWIAPETKNDRQSSKESDIYSLGYLIYFMMTEGKFPENRTIQPIDFGAIESSDGNLAIDLVSRMIELKPSKRLTIEEVSLHAFFWNNEKILKIFANIIETTEGISDAQILERINMKDRLNTVKKTDVIGNDWKEKITGPDWITFRDNELDAYKKTKKEKDRETIISGNTDLKPISKDLLRKSLKLNEDCVYDLIKYIRNKRMHLKDTQQTEKIFGNNDEEFLDFWRVKFPNLIQHIYENLGNQFA